MDTEVTQLRSLYEAEQFIKAGIPIVASIAFQPNKLTGDSPPSHPHDQRHVFIFEVAREQPQAEFYALNNRGDQRAALCAFERYQTSPQNKLQCFTAADRATLGRVSVPVFPHRGRLSCH